MKKEITLTVMILIVIIFLIVFYFSSNKTKVSNKSKGTMSYCSSSLSFSLSGNGTCNLTAYISSSNCKNKKYKIENNDTKCSNTIKSDREVVFCGWQVPFGNYSYNLYIDDELKTSQSIRCPKFIIPCPTCPE